MTRALSCTGASGAIRTTRASRGLRRSSRPKRRRAVVTGT